MRDCAPRRHVLPNVLPDANRLPDAHRRAAEPAGEENHAAAAIIQSSFRSSLRRFRLVMEERKRQCPQPQPEAWSTEVEASEGEATYNTRALLEGQQLQRRQSQSQGGEYQPGDIRDLSDCVAAVLDPASANHANRVAVGAAAARPALQGAPRVGAGKEEGHTPTHKARHASPLERPLATRATFVAALAFDGARRGYVFKLGKHGLGYYLDWPFLPGEALGRPGPRLHTNASAAQRLAPEETEKETEKDLAAAAQRIIESFKRSQQRRRAAARSEREGNLRLPRRTSPRRVPRGPTASALKRHFDRALTSAQQGLEKRAPVQRAPVQDREPRGLPRGPTYAGLNPHFDRGHNMAIREGPGVNKGTKVHHHATGRDPELDALRAELQRARAQVRALQAREYQ
jgi:hypothetical protein